MITNPHALRKFEDNLVSRDLADYRKNLRIVEALYREAVSLKVFPGRNHLEGIETSIELARILNSV